MEYILLSTAGRGTHYHEGKPVGDAVAPPWGELGLDALGSSMDLDGNRLITGAYGAAIWTIDANAGSVALEAILNLPAEDAWIFAFFGYAVALSGDVAVVGARNAGATGGSVYVYERNPDDGTWPMTQRISASDAEGGEFFGHAVSISGDRILVGAQQASIGGNANAGAAYVFEKAGDVWTQSAKLVSSAPAEDHRFDWDVDIDR